MKNIVTKKSVLNLLNSTFPNTRIHIENLSKTNLEFSLKTLGSSDISEPKIIKHDNFDLLYIGKLKIDGKCVYTYQIHNIVNDELIHDVLSIIYRNQLEANLGGIVGGEENEIYAELDIRKYAKALELFKTKYMK